MRSKQAFVSHSMDFESFALLNRIVDMPGALYRSRQIDARSEFRLVSVGQ